MPRLSSLVLVAAAVSALHLPQIPLLEPQISLGEDDPRPWVTTDALQGSISAEKLWKRAEKLYDLAKESVHEYGHPTRVIGSKGMCF